MQGRRPCSRERVAIARRIHDRAAELLAFDLPLEPQVGLALLPLRRDREAECAVVVGHVADRACAPELAHEAAHECVVPRPRYFQPGRVRTSGIRDDQVPPPQERWRWGFLRSGGNRSHKAERDGERGARDQADTRHGMSIE